jgi:hypothetical protein
MKEGMTWRKAREGSEFSKGFETGGPTRTTAAREVVFPRRKAKCFLALM